MKIDDVQTILGRHLTIEIDVLEMMQRFFAQGPAECAERLNVFKYVVWKKRKKTTSTQNTIKSTKNPRGCFHAVFLCFYFPIRKTTQHQGKNHLRTEDSKITGVGGPPPSTLQMIIQLPEKQICVRKSKNRHNRIFGQIRYEIRNQCNM